LYRELPEEARSAQSIYLNQAPLEVTDEVLVCCVSVLAPPSASAAQKELRLSMTHTRASPK
jgi:hypothetical protein